MEIANNFFNFNILFQFIGALFSIILTVTIIYIKRGNDRKERENFYNGQIDNGAVLGDIKIKVDEDLPRENYLKLMTMWGIQPLLLLVFISFIDNNSSSNAIKIIICFGLIIFTLLHEFTFAVNNSDKPKYQIFMLIVWLLSFVVLSYEKNINEMNKNKTETELTKSQKE